MGTAFVLSTLVRRGLLTPGRPDRMLRQLDELRRWGFGLAGELRSAAARSPDSIAIVDEVVGQLTYRRLDARVRQLMRALPLATGIRPGDRVGLLCRNHTGFVEATIATTALGADAVLINTGLSVAQISSVVEDHQIRVLIYDEEFGELLGGVPQNVHRILADAPPRRMSPTLAGLIETAPGDSPPRPGESGRLIVLTSGTTGTPKGARRRTPSGFAPLAALISRIPWEVGCRMLISAPLFHTWGLSTLQVTLALRGTAVLQRRFDPYAALQAVAVNDCDSMVVVPVMLQRLLDLPGPVRPATPTLRIVATSGSSLPGNLAIAFMDEFGDVLYNLYGSTEASWASIATPAELRRDPSCSGRPPRGTKVAILGPNGHPVSPGSIGRIYVGNEMLFEGYTNGAQRSSDGLLATGDLGHVSKDGLLHVDGRIDDMVISGGENVYPSQVESVVSQLPQVREVAVTGVPDIEFGQRLVAFVVVKPGEWLDPEAVREFVRLHLARFAVPRDVYFVEALPRNATGKVVVRQLFR